MKRRIFGLQLRALREAKRLGLRELAHEARISPAFLSKVEHGKVTPPAERKLNALARALDCDAEELMVLAGRLPADVLEIIQTHPLQYLALLRQLRARTANELEQIRVSFPSPLSPDVERLIAEIEASHSNVEIDKASLEGLFKLLIREKQEVK